MGVQMRLAAACVAAEDDIVVCMRIHRPDVLVEPELLLDGLPRSDEKLLALEEASQVLRHEHEDVLQDLEGACAGKLDSVGLPRVLADEGAALVLGGAGRRSGELHDVLRLGGALAPEDHEVSALLVVAPEVGHALRNLDDVALAEQLEAHLGEQGVVVCGKPCDAAGVELADALGDEALHFGMGEALVELRGLDSHDAEAL